MKERTSSTYRDVGVLSNEELGLESLLKWIIPTKRFREGKPTGRSLLDIGYFANVIDVGNGIGLALTTDGVGTKVLVAEALQKYDTIGIDCVAMNVNDVICVGAEPVAMLDYLAIATPMPGVLEAIGEGLSKAASLAGISIVGGEIAQIKEMIRGEREGEGLDLVGMCVGVVPTDKINTGQDTQPGDLIVGLRSSGIHSNGLTLARRTLLQQAQLKLDTYVPELRRALGDELLEPTHIYVPEIMDLLNESLVIRALVNITSDGFLNLARINARVGFRIEELPEPHPIFTLIEERGRVGKVEMFHVFNMGIGFCVIVPNDGHTAAAVHRIATKHGVESYAIGRVIDDPQKQVHLPAQGLIGRGDRFYPI